MKVMKAYFRMFFHCLIYTHQMEVWSTNFLFKIPIKYHKLMCATCNKVYYNDNKYERVIK